MVMVEGDQPQLVLKDRFGNDRVILAVFDSGDGQLQILDSLGNLEAIVP
jgi:hypothetical protein